jgi:hypothetical protein
VQNETQAVGREFSWNILRHVRRKGPSERGCYTRLSEVGEIGLFMGPEKKSTGFGDRQLRHRGDKSSGAGKAKIVWRVALALAEEEISSKLFPGQRQAAVGLS